MHRHQTVSSYLAQPDLSRRHTRHWEGFRSRFIAVKRANPRLIPRLVVALLLWTIVYGGLSYAISPRSLASQTTLASGRTPVAQSSTINAPTALGQLTDAQTVPTAAASTISLSDGPADPVILPIAMAPEGTYSNDYDWGQCTWYVAGRRLVPSNWGNADTWYYRAADDGWSVGSVPAVGAIAWTPAGYYGHVALVEQISPDYSHVYVSEMNYVGLDTRSYRWVPSASFKYIY